MTVNNKSGLKDAVISSFIDRLHGGAAIKTNELETVLNNLNDLPGIRAAGMLKAGASVGSSDLEIIVADKKAVETILNTAAVTATAFRLPLTTPGVLAINLLWAEL